jgi:hypothetical protein
MLRSFSLTIYRFSHYSPMANDSHLLTSSTGRWHCSCTIVQSCLTSSVKEHVVVRWSEFSKVRHVKSVTNQRVITCYGGSVKILALLEYNPYSPSVVGTNARSAYPTSSLRGSTSVLGPLTASFTPKEASIASRYMTDFERAPSKQTCG